MLARLALVVGTVALASAFVRAEPPATGPATRWAERDARADLAPLRSALQALADMPEGTIVGRLEEVRVPAGAQAHPKAGGSERARTLRVAFRRPGELNVVTASPDGDTIRELYAADGWSYTTYARGTQRRHDVDAFSRPRRALPATFAEVPVHTLLRADAAAYLDRHGMTNARLARRMQDAAGTAHLVFAFDEPASEHVGPRAWEVWVTADAPHRLARVAIEEGGTFTFVEVPDLKPGEDEVEVWANDRGRVVETPIAQRVRTEWRFESIAPTADAGVFDVPVQTMPPGGDATKLILDGAPIPQGVEPLARLEGDAVDLRAPRNGRPMLLDFWFAACGPCRASFPDTLALAARYPGLDVVYVNRRDAPERAAQAAREFNLPAAAVALDRDGAVGRAFGVTGFPTCVLVGPDGRVVTAGSPLDAYTRDNVEEALRAMFPDN